MLSTLIWLPVLGAAVIGFLPGNQTANQLRNIALGIATAIVLATFWLVSQFDITSSQMQFQEFIPWIPQLGLNYKLGIDGISFPLLALSSLLIWIAIIASNNIQRPRLYYSLILLVYSGVAGGFVAQNLLLFVLFYEIELIPFYLLIAIWGGEKRGYAAMKFLIYTALSG
ncbi:MAG TPA: NAD(P)H-quinone oxidoreductase subunit D4, partial [Cyanobacteria bacterium UBA11368]|nr:NAD(P)H-quinone oxidoreductase subunit D4 [Cyanobacteria bacterium UBA11368]